MKEQLQRKLLSSRNEEITAIERGLLRLLCQGGMDAPLRGEVLARLRGYAFRHVEHQVLFDCLRGLPTESPELIRSLLPERLVRVGFPDFNLAPFFEPHGFTEAEVTGLLEELKEPKETKDRTRAE